jgi:hypothetical protein
MIQEDCNSPSVFFILEINNFKNKGLKLKSKEKLGFCEQIRFPSDATLICSNGDSLSLQIIENYEIMNPGPVVRIKCVLKFYEIKGSIFQIQEKLYEKIGRKFYITTSEIVENKTIVFKINGKINEHYYLNLGEVESKEDKQKGYIKNPIFKPYERIKFSHPQ